MTKRHDATGERDAAEPSAGREVRYWVLGLLFGVAAVVGVGEARARLDTKRETLEKLANDDLQWMALGIETPFHFGVDHVAFTHARLVKRTNLSAADFDIRVVPGAPRTAREVELAAGFTDATLYDAALLPSVTMVNLLGEPICGEIPEGLTSETLAQLFAEPPVPDRLPIIRHMKPRRDRETGEWIVDAVRVIGDSGGRRAGGLIYHIRLARVSERVAPGNRGSVIPGGRALILRADAERTVYMADHGAGVATPAPSVGSSYASQELEDALRGGGDIVFFRMTVDGRVHYCRANQTLREVYGYIVLAMMDDSLVMAEWRRDRDLTLVVGGGFALVGVFLVAQDERRRRMHRERVRAQAELEESARREVALLRDKAELEEKVAERSAEILAQNATLAARIRELDTSNRELATYANTVSCDLHLPLRSIAATLERLRATPGSGLDAASLNYLDKMVRGARRMNEIVDDLLRLSTIADRPLAPERVNLSVMASQICETLRDTHPGREVSVIIEPDCEAEADPALVRVALENLLSNAWKYSSKKPRATIAFGRDTLDGSPAFAVRDDGAGFDPALAGRLFVTFSRLHRQDEFEGTGVGLATVARIIARHGGRIAAEGRPGEGAIFRFTLGGAPR